MEVRSRGRPVVGGVNWKGVEVVGKGEGGL